MLVLSRRVGERIIIHIGGEIAEVFITEIKDGRTVKVGIEAPQSVHVDREEVYESKYAQGETHG